jgi:hypothetical protein
MRFPRKWMEGLGPYQSLVLLAVPLAIVEPAKLGALAFAGEGHWLTGTVIMIGAYALSILVVDRLFRVLKANLMKLWWFASAWRWFTAVRAKAISPFTK